MSDLPTVLAAARALRREVAAMRADAAPRGFRDFVAYDRRLFEVAPDLAAGRALCVVVPSLDGRALCQRVALTVINAAARRERCE